MAVSDAQPSKEGDETQTVTLGRKRSDVMLDAPCRPAEAVWLHRLCFVLSEEAFERFTAALDEPPRDNPKLRRLLQTDPPWA